MSREELTRDQRRKVALHLTKGTPTNYIADELGVPEHLVIEELKRQDREVEGND